MPFKFLQFTATVALKRAILLPMLMLHASICMAMTPPPNIVVIYTDDQGWTSTSVQMDPNIPESKSDFIQTPRLEQLATEGLRFSSAYAEPICSSSRAALQTGKSPAQLQMTDVSVASELDSSWYDDRYHGEALSAPVQPRNLDFSQDTIAEHLKNNGTDYVTAHFGKWHVSRDVFQSNPVYGYDFNLLTHNSSEYPEGDPKNIFSYTDTAIDFMQDRVTADEPFFMQVSHIAPHNPFEARQATLDKYNNLPPGTRHTNPTFAAMTEDLDTGVGMLLDEIDSLGIRDNTYVIYISDNGGIASLGTEINAPLYHAKGSVFEGGIRVPMFVSGPGITPNSVSDVPVSIRDIFATVSDIAGISEVPSDLESASLLPVLENNGQLPNDMPSLQRAFAPGGEIFFHSPHHQQQPTGFTNRGPQSGVRDGNYKLVKMYGETPSLDRIFLYDLSQNITETEDPNSPLNLADDFPDKTAELLAKLDKYLEDSDASMPFRVWDDIELRWDASARGSRPDSWRSTIDVDHNLRERWWPALFQSGPTQADASPHQPNLPKKAFQFNGNQGLTRHFFHVSDNDKPDLYDADHSATFEFWMRTDDLTQDQIIFETGSADVGLSVTLGDGDNDGDHDEVRVRVRGGADGGQQTLTLTSELDKFADVTQDFVQVSVVVSDDDIDRYLALYVNGALFGKVDGVLGSSGRLSWDDWPTGLDFAGLGSRGGTSVGANSGTGDLPFVGGNFRGELSLVRYFNHAISSETIHSHYNSVLHPVDHGIHSRTGDVLIPSQRPASVSLNTIESDSLMVFQERNDTLAQPLDVDSIVTQGLGMTSLNTGVAGTLPTGTEVTSYLLQFDPSTNDNSTNEFVTGAVQFSQEILGIILDPNSLAASDGMLGAVGDYGLASERGLIFNGSDFLGVSNDRKTLVFSLEIPSDELLQFRVVTEQTLSGDFDLDGLITSKDLDVFYASYGNDDGADANFDGVTNGLDFLAWQEQFNVTPRVFTADFNGDGLVDSNDLAILEASYGTNDGADTNANGVTDGLDFLQWQLEYNGGTPSGIIATASTVPEPTTLVLCLTVLPFFYRQR